MSVKVYVRWSLSTLKSIYFKAIFPYVDSYVNPYVEIDPSDLRNTSRISLALLDSFLDPGGVWDD